MTCELCDDGDGHCVFPYYGLAPHKHFARPGGMMGTTIAPCESWPENFTEDSDAPGCGTYTHCPACGAPDAATSGGETT